MSKPANQMRIHNLNGLPKVDYRSVRDFQDGLKDLTQANHDKLLRVLKKRGFTIPLYVWRNPTDQCFYSLDGHQRRRVMATNDLNDNGSYEVPFVQIPARDEKEARAQLLEITSQYGTLTPEGLDSYLAMAELDTSALEDVSFDAIDFDKFLDVMGDNGETVEDTKTKKAKRYTVPELKELIQTYYPAKAAECLVVLDWVATRE